MVLWDVAVDPVSGKVRESFTCPTCAASWRKAQVRWLRSEPVVTNYECERCKPKRAGHPTTEAEKQRIAEIENAEIRYWYPTASFEEKDWEMWRGVHRGQQIADVSKFFTSRNLWAAAQILSEVQGIPNVQVREAIRFVFTSGVVLLSKLTRYNMGKRGNGPVTGTLYVASFVAENNALTLLQGKLDDCVRLWHVPVLWARHMR